MANERIRLLMVEDAAADAELIVRGLARARLECAVLRVDTEPAFVKALREHRPDVILSDFSMPRFDGLRALEIAVQYASDVPFIFVSGTIGEERAIDALRRGATDYVLKGNLNRLGAAIERALAETALKTARRQAEQQLRDNEQRLRDTVETSQDWIWEVDQQGRFRFCSAAVASMLGYEPGALIGQDYRQYLDQDSAIGSKGLLPRAGAPLTGAVASWRAADGQTRWLERNAVAIVDIDGELIGYRGTDRDITARREQEERLQRLTRTYRMLSSTGSAILRLTERGALLQELCRIAVQQGGYDRVLIALRERSDESTFQLARAGEDAAALRAIDRSLLATLGSPVTPGLDAPLVNNDLARDAEAEIVTATVVQSLPESERQLLVAQGYRALAALPLKIDGAVSGILLLFSRQSGVFDQIELQVLQEFTANLGFALQYHQRDEALQFLSYYDSLTGLAKRGLFCQRLEHWLNSQPAAAAVVLFDVQQLGAINDTYGRYVGDALIAAIATRLRESYGTDNTAYLGGGTFGMLHDAGIEPTGATAGGPLHQAVGRLFHEPFSIEGQELRPVVRVGIAQHPQDAKVADALVQNAEAALKAAREENERFLPFGQIRHRHDTRSLALENRLAGALEREEFLLHYQPKVDLQTGRVVGLEALLRWQDARDGLISPAVFVPMLERSGAIAEVGEWVIQQSVRDAAAWWQAGVAPVRIAVNVSPLQLRRRDFVERVLAGTRSGTGESSGIDVEITESMLMQDLELSIRKLRELSAAGVGVAIDDFGTGYSSLRMLSRLPVDTLKIDRSFIQGMSEGAGGAMLVSTVVALAGAFGMMVIAEGVETAEQASELRRMRCEQAQGYLFCRPAPAAQVPGAIERLNSTGMGPEPATL